MQVVANKDFQPNAARFFYYFKLFLDKARESMGAASSKAVLSAQPTAPTQFKIQNTSLSPTNSSNAVQDSKHLSQPNQLLQRSQDSKHLSAQPIQFLRPPQKRALRKALTGLNAAQ